MLPLGTRVLGTPAADTPQGDVAARWLGARRLFHRAVYFVARARQRVVPALALSLPLQKTNSVAASVQAPSLSA
jgi:hypothetical protein